MKPVSFDDGKDFNLLLQFPIFLVRSTQKALALYQLERVPLPIKDINTEVISCTWLLLRKECLAMTGEN